MTTDLVHSADGTRIALRRIGEGKPLVFAHGASGDKDSHPALRDMFARTFGVTSYDRRGRGDSGDAVAYGFLKEADDLRAVIAAQPEPPLVFGVSMGARIALEMLRDAPPLAAMVLFEPPVTEAALPAFSERLVRVRQVLEDKGKEAATVLHSELFHNRSMREIDALRQEADRWALRVETFPITLREMEAVHRDCLFAAANYRAPGFPVHALFGDATLDFLRQSRSSIEKLPFVTVHTLPGQTHSAPGDAPAIVMAAFEECLQATPMV